MPIPRTNNCLRLWTLLPLTFLLLLSSSASAGSLDDIRKEVKKKKEKKEESKSTSSSSNNSSHSSCPHYHSHHHHCSHCGWSHDNDTQDAIIFFYVISSPFWGPNAIVESDLKNPTYLTYPYQNGNVGYIEDNPDGSEHAFSFTLEGGTAPYGYNQSAELRATIFKRLELQLSSKRLIEPTQLYYFDTLHLLEPRLNVVFAMGKRALFRTGLGLNILSDPQSDPVYGFGYHYDMDFFPIRPLVLSIRLGAGILGEAVTWQTRFTAGVSLANLELFGGYDFHNIGEQEIGGPIAGARLWF